MKKSVASGAAAVVLGLTLAVAGGANGAGNATAIKLATVLNASQEVPAPTGEVAAARARSPRQSMLPRPALRSPGS